MELREDQQRNLGAVYGLCSVIKDTVNKYPDENFYQILNKLGIIPKSIDVDFDEPSYITAQKLLTGGKLRFIYDDIMFENKDVATENVKSKDKNKDA